MATEKLRYVISVEGGREFKQQMKSARQTTETESKGIIGNFKGIAGAAKLFLASAVVVSVGKAISSMVDLAEQTRVVGRSYERLTNSIGQNSEMILRSMRRGVGGAVADLELMRKANQAILLGIPVTASQMEKLAQTAVRLGRAVGRDANEALGDLITGIGRMSPLILDNLGITIKAEEAFRGLGDGATDAQKRIAFFNAVMEKAADRSKTLGDIQPSVGEKMDILAAKVSNLAAQIGEGLAGSILSVISAYERLAAMVGGGGGEDAFAKRLGYSDYDAMAGALEGSPKTRSSLIKRIGAADAQNFGPRFGKVGSITSLRERAGPINPNDEAVRLAGVVAAGQGPIEPLQSTERVLKPITDVAEKAQELFVDVPKEMQMGFEDAFRYIQGQFAFLGAQGRGLFGGILGIVGGARSAGVGFGDNEKFNKAVRELTMTLGAAGALVGGVQTLGSIFGGRTVDVNTASDEDLREIVRNNRDANLHPGIRNEARRAEEELRRRQQTGSQTVNRTIQTLTDESFRVYAGEFSALHALHKQYMPYLEEIAMNTRGGGGGEGAALMVDKSKRAGGF